MGHFPVEHSFPTKHNTKTGEDECKPYTHETMLGCTKPVSLYAPTDSWLGSESLKTRALYFAGDI